METNMPEVPLGMGSEKVVYPYGDDGDRVVAFIYNSHDRSTSAGDMKGKFYAGKLLHVLMPENFPDVHMTGSQPPMIIAERINPPENFVLRALAWARRPIANRRLIRRGFRLWVYLQIQLLTTS